MKILEHDPLGPFGERDSTFFLALLHDPDLAILPVQVFEHKPGQLQPAHTGRSQDPEDRLSARTQKGAQRANIQNGLEILFPQELKRSLCIGPNLGLGGDIA